MKPLFKPAFAAGFAMLATIGFATPATAQAAGNIGTVETAFAVARADALAAAYNQITQTYQQQLTTISQRAQQRQQLVQSFDSNGDGQLDQTEQAATQDPQNATVQQIQAIDTEVQRLQGPIQRARLYVVEQLAAQFAPAVQQVVADKNLQFVLQPDALIFAADAANVTADVTTAINARAPSVTAFPPEGWQPGNDEVIALFQQIQQIIAIQQVRAAQQAAQQQNGDVPSR